MRREGADHAKAVAAGSARLSSSESLRRDVRHDGVWDAGRIAATFGSHALNWPELRPRHWRLRDVVDRACRVASPRSVDQNADRSLVGAGCPELAAGAHAPSSKALPEAFGWWPVVSLTPRPVPEVTHRRSLTGAHSARVRATALRQGPLMSSLSGVCRQQASQLLATPMQPCPNCGSRDPHDGGDLSAGTTLECEHPVGGLQVAGKPCDRCAEVVLANVVPWNRPGRLLHCYCLGRLNLKRQLGPPAAKPKHVNERAVQDRE
jgi:hypothetical protein